MRLAADAAPAQKAIGSGLTAGIGQGVNAALAAPNPALAAGTTGASETMTGSTSAYAQAIVRTAASDTANQLVRGEWSWRELGASVVGSAAGTAAGSAVSSMIGQSTNNFALQNLSGQLAAGEGSHWAQNQVLATDPRYTKARTGSIFVASLGSALGGVVGDSSSWGEGGEDSAGGAGDAIQEDPLGNFINRNSPEWATRYYQDTGQTDIFSDDELPTALGSATTNSPSSSGTLSLVGGEKYRTGDYLGSYNTFEYGQGSSGTQLVTQTLHQGILPTLDDALASAADRPQQWTASVQAWGEQSALDGNSFRAGLSAFSYTPLKTLANIASGVITVPRVLTSDTIVPGLYNAAAHPVNALNAAWDSFSNLSLQDETAAALSILVPGIGSRFVNVATELPSAGRYLEFERFLGLVRLIVSWLAILRAPKHP